MHAKNTSYKLYSSYGDSYLWITFINFSISVKIIGNFPRLNCKFSIFSKQKSISICINLMTLSVDEEIFKPKNTFSWLFKMLKFPYSKIRAINDKPLTLIFCLDLQWWFYCLKNLSYIYGTKILCKGNSIVYYTTLHRFLPNRDSWLIGTLVRIVDGRVRFLNDLLVNP